MVPESNEYFSPSSLSDFVYRQGLSEANCERSESRDHQQISRNSVSGHTTSGKELVIFFPSLFRSYPLSFPLPESLFLPPLPACLPPFFPATLLINIFSCDICLCANQVPQTDSSSNEIALPSPLDGVRNRELLVKYSLRHPASLQVEFSSSR